MVILKCVFFLEHLASCTFRLHSCYLLSSLAFLEEAPLIGKAVNSSAIHLSWTNPDDLLALGYFVQYKKVTEEEKSSAEESKMITVPLRGNRKVSLMKGPRTQDQSIFYYIF